jgi:hypothetical protein
MIFIVSLTRIMSDSRMAQRLAKLGMVCAVLGFIIWSAS